MLPGRVTLNGHPDLRLPNTLNISIAGASGIDLLAVVPEITASTGSACRSATTTLSLVLTAMGIPADRALCAVCLSLGPWSTSADVDQAAALLTAAAKSLR